MEPGERPEEQKGGAGAAPDTPTEGPGAAQVEEPITEKEYQIATGTISNFLLFRKIGYGASCKVYRAKDMLSG